MTSSSETAINLKTLQRVDSKIVEIIDTASQVAIYKYETRLEKWEGTEVEGTLFLYRKSSYPYHGFIIINRLNTTNFVESITSDMQFKLQEPYLLYKNQSGDIIGSWFYEYKDLQRISKKIQTIVLTQSTVPRRQRCASESESLPVVKEGGQDIMTLLSDAHKEYMKTVKELPKPTLGDVNRLCAHSDKSLPEKSVVGFKIQEHVSPRRRFRSTGSYSSDVASELPSVAGIQKIKNSNENLNRIQAEKDLKVASLAWVGSTLPSPFITKIASPISDVEFLNDSSEASPPDGNFNFQMELSHQKSFENIHTNCDMHSSTIKQTLKSFIQDDPKVLLKIHEAYVCSLRSLFSKD